MLTAWSQTRKPKKPADIVPALTTQTPKKKDKKMGYFDEDKVKKAVGRARLIGWDECHKIYLALDKAEAQTLIDLGYLTCEGNTETMYATVEEWYRESCGLRFIQSTKQDKKTGQTVFKSVVAQD